MTGQRAEEIKAGHCLCGACRFELRGPHNWVGHCHCESCRRATASPLTTFIGHPNGQWRWTGAAVTSFASRADVTRGFCPTCGTPMVYASDKFPDETHFYAALLSDPSLIVPEATYFAHEALIWAPPFAGVKHG